MLKPLLPPEEWQAARQRMITVPHRLVDPERVDIWTSERQTRKSLRRSPIRPMPLVVITHGHPDPDTPYVELEEPFWQRLQRELARLVPGGRLVVATESGHDIQHEQPELVLDALRDVVLAVRAGDLVQTQVTRSWLEQVALPAASRLQVTTALRQIDRLDLELDPLERWLRAFARRQPGCRALIDRHYGSGC